MWVGWVMEVERTAATLSLCVRFGARTDEEYTLWRLANSPPNWIEARYAAGIAALIEGLEKILIRRCTHARRKARQSDTHTAEAVASRAIREVGCVQSKSLQKENDQDQEVDP